MNTSISGRRLVRLLAGLAGGLSLVLSLGAAAGARTAASGGIWGTAKEVPGTATLNKGFAQITSVSCASNGNCSAGGDYLSDSSGHSQAFVVTEIHDTWGTAREVPGTATLNKGGNAEIESVSCASAGNCSAGGYYIDSSNKQQVFVVSQVNGSWGTAKEVPGTAALNQGGSAQITSLSCASAGNCSAGGFYSSSYNNPRYIEQAFVVSQVNGIWRTAKEVPRTAKLNAGGYAFVRSVSCASAGNCSAGGEYASSYDSTNGLTSHAFVVSEVNGRWGAARETATALNTAGSAEVYSVSCASAGNCSAGGYYSASRNQQAFVVGETNGAWGKAEEVPGTAALNKGPFAFAGVNSVSCPSAGNCSAAGSYTDSGSNSQSFAANETNGTWRKAKEIPGSASLDFYDSLDSVSCWSAGNCSAVGSFGDPGPFDSAYVVNETNGTWGTAKPVPGLAKLNKGGDAGVNSLSCSSAGECSAGGFYLGSSISQAFVVSET